MKYTIPTLHTLDDAKHLGCFDGSGAAYAAPPSCANGPGVTDADCTNGAGNLTACNAGTGAQAGGSGCVVGTGAGSMCSVGTSPAF